MVRGAWTKKVYEAIHLDHLHPSLWDLEHVPLRKAANEKPEVSSGR
jgi:hypothetical protein